MNKKVKIIELLQDFADEKEIIMPKYIRYWDRIGHKDEVMLVCKANIIKKLDDCRINLNDEVEILEDNTEEIEELQEFDIQGLEISGYSMTQAEYLLEDGVNENRDKINEIIRYIKRKDKNND